MEFKDFKVAIEANMLRMESNGHPLFRVNISPDRMWDLYLLAFTDDQNPIFREKRVHDCNCCKHFFRNAGNMVQINPITFKLESIFAVDGAGDYQGVTDRLREVVESASVKDLFLTEFKDVGQDRTVSLKVDSEGNNYKESWDHLHHKFQPENVNEYPASKLGKVRESFQMLKRMTETFTDEALLTTAELVDGGLYRGEQNKPVLSRLIKFWNSYQELKPENSMWLVATKDEAVCRIRNTSFGTLIDDLSEGRMSTEKVVNRYEAMVAPDNYKRTVKIITPMQLKLAKDKVVELGFMKSLERRHAIPDDISIANVIYADHSFKSGVDIFDKLIQEQTKYVASKLKGVEEVGYTDFINKVIPNSSNVEALFENRHSSNLMSLTTAVHPDSPSMFAWDNQEAWTYNGDVTDSLMAQTVRSKGGDTDGVLRFSIMWNEDSQSNTDFDAHCMEPNGHIIYYSNKGRTHPSSGKLDVDIMDPRGELAVENIVYKDLQKMPLGTYELLVHNYSGGTIQETLKAELVVNGRTYFFTYDQEIRGCKYIQFATFEVRKQKDGTRYIEVSPTVEANETSQDKEHWGLQIDQFHPVTMITRSPNHIGDNETGNKHLFFIMQDCLCGEEVKGFYQEYLTSDLYEVRKSFELLGSKLKVKKSAEQLSGIGFSSTQRNNAIFRVDEKLYNVKF